MSPTDLSPATDAELQAVTIEPWPDPLIDRLGHDPRSAYAELYWLPILGPTTSWLLRRIAAGFDDAPEGFQLPVGDTARSLGLGNQTGRHSVFMRSLRRACTFKLSQGGDDLFRVRRRLPPLTRAQIAKLPQGLRRSHDDQVDRDLHRTDAAETTRKARRLALTLLELGEDVTSAERHLHLWRFAPETSRDAAVWAHQRHHHAAQAASAG